jgi:hypothetical protein
MLSDTNFNIYIARRCFYTACSCVFDYNTDTCDPINTTEISHLKVKADKFYRDWSIVNFKHDHSGFESQKAFQPELRPRIRSIAS